MKIVGVSNHCLDHVSDILVAESTPSAAYANVMCAALNEKFSGPNEPTYYMVRADDYELYKWEPW